MTELIERPAAADALESSYVTRPADPTADLARIVRLLNEIEAVDQIGEGTSEVEFRSDLTAPEQTTWVVEQPGDPDRLVAHLVVWKGDLADEAHLNIHVHPDWRRRGLGSALLARGLAHARAAGAVAAGTGAEDRVPGRAAFLTRHGFRPDSTWIEMRAPADVVLAAPAWPAGYEVRTYADMQQPAVLLDALNRGFIGHHGHHDDTEAELSHWLAEPRVRADGIFLAFGPAGDVAGVCWTDLGVERSARLGLPVGYINALAVVPEHRRHGLGRALLLTGMGWLRAHGQATIDLDAWGENDMALPLYYGVGFTLLRHGTGFRLAL